MKTGMKRINEFFAIWIMAFTVVPAIKAPVMGSFYRIIMLMGLGGWFISAFSINKMWLLRPRKSLFLVLILNLFYLLMILLKSGDIADFFVMILLFWVPFYIFEFYYYIGDKQTMRRLLIVAFVCLLSVILTTLFYVIKSPYLIRTVFKDGAEAIITYYRLNIGDLGFIYALELLLSVFVAILAVRILRNVKEKMYFAVMIVLSVAVIVNASSGFMMIGLGIIFCEFLYYRATPKMRIFVIIGFVTFLLLILPTSATLLTRIAETTENIYYKEKLLDVANTLQFGVDPNNKGSTASRLFAYRTDLTTAFRHPILGVGAYYRHNDSVGLNGHSAMFGDMARYGLLFSTFMCYLFTQIKRSYISIRKDYHFKKIVDAVFVIFWFQYLINPITQEATIGWVMWFVFPGMLMMIRSKYDRTNEFGDTEE